MASVFLDKFRRRDLAPVTFLVLELFREQQERGEAAVSADDQLCMLRAAFIEAGVEVDEKSAQAAFIRLQAPAAADEALRDAAPPKMGRTISEYLQSLDSVQLCLLASDFDVERAERLYCDTDFEVVQFLATERSRWEMVSYFSHQEAIAIGFGGTPKDGDDMPGERRVNTVAEASVASLNDRMGFLRGITH